MLIEQYIPRTLPQIVKNEDRSEKMVCYELGGIVELFTYPGDEQHRAFTTLEMWIYPHKYVGRIGRHYHRRWFRRLARQFARQCRELAKAG